MNHMTFHVQLLNNKGKAGICKSNKGLVQVSLEPATLTQQLLTPYHLMNVISEWAILHMAT